MPSPAHLAKATWVEKAVQAGKHIFLNKPMAESLDSALRIEKAVAGSKIQLVYDIPAIARFNPVTSKLLAEVRAGEYGRAINYTHTFSFTFSTDFPLAEVWPERLDPPARSGGGELTNLGSYAVDYMIGLWGRPGSIQAKSTAYWDVYRDAEVENFAQVIADYGDFFAVLASGKQPLQGLPSMDVAEALNPRNWHNVLELQFEQHNLTALPFENLLIHNGKRIPLEQYLTGYTCPTPFQQLLRAIETGQTPDSSVASARLGVEVLTAAYSRLNGAAHWWRCPKRAAAICAPIYRKHIFAVARPAARAHGVARYFSAADRERRDHDVGIRDPAEFHREVAQGRRVQVGREARDGVRHDRRWVAVVECLPRRLLDADLGDGFP